MPGNQTETAYCSTSAINPTLVQLSPAAADYSKFGAYCKLTPSTGAVIYSTECPPGSVYNSGSQPPATANPMGECDIVFQPQPGVTYTINSNHWLWPNMLPLSQCGFQDYRAYCLSDPLGYYSFNPGAADPFPTTPTYTGVSSYVSLLAINTVDDPCSVMGTCSPQNISDIYCTNYIIIGGLPICHSGGISVPDVWEIAHTSEPWTPKCSDVVQGSVTPVAYSSPLTDGPNAGATITATFTPNFGYTLLKLLKYAASPTLTGNNSSPSCLCRTLSLPLAAGLKCMRHPDFSILRPEDIPMNFQISTTHIRSITTQIQDRRDNQN